MICLSLTAVCYGKLCQTQPINIQLRKSFDLGLPLVELRCMLSSTVELRWSSDLV